MIPNRIINLYWTAPDAGGQEITGYEIDVSDTKTHWPSDEVSRPTARVGNVKAVTGIAGVNGGQLAPDPADTTNPYANVAVIAVSAGSQTAEQPYQLQHTYTGSDEDNSEATNPIFKSTLYYRVRTITGSGTSEKKSTYVTGEVKITFDVDDDTTVAGYPTAVIAAPVVSADVGAPNDITGDDDNDNDNAPAVVQLAVTQVTDGANSYRVDVSTDDGKTWTTEETDTRPINETEYEHEGENVKAGKGYRFRLFAKKGKPYGLASAVVQDFAGHSKRPGAVEGLNAEPNGAGEIALSWTAPKNNGGAMIDKYCIVANEVDGGDFTRANIDTTGALTDDTDDADADDCTRFGDADTSPISLEGKVQGIFEVSPSTATVTFNKVLAETQWTFEVYALNGATGPTGATGVASTADGRELDTIGLALTSDKVDATTAASVLAPAPVNLSAENARDTNLTGVEKRGVLVLWNAPADPAGAPVLNYRVERKVMGEDDDKFIIKVDNLSAAETHWVDPEELGEDVRYYRVTSINSVGVGTATAMVTIPLAEHTTHTTTPAVDELTAPSLPRPRVVTVGGIKTISLLWDSGEGEERQIVQLLTEDRMFVDSQTVMPDVESADFDNDGAGIAPGTYRVQILALGTGTDFRNSGTFLVTVE